MEGREIIQKLKTWGYLPGVADADVEKLTLRSSEVRQAIETYSLVYQPEHVTDDGADPDFDRLVTDRFCDVPDFAPDGAEAANGPLEANWPTDCRGRLRFGLTFANLPGLTQEQTRQAFVAALNCWNLSTDILCVPTNDWGRQGASIWAGRGKLSGSTLAWSYLARSICSAVLEQRYNDGRSWQLWYLATVAAHELGHAFGHNHINTTGALMRPEINQQSLARKGWPAAADFAQAQRLGYRVTNQTRPSDDVMIRIPGLTPTPGPEPKPPPTDPNDPFIGVYTMPNGKRYVVSPFPEF